MANKKRKPDANDYDFEEHNNHQQPKETGVIHRIKLDFKCKNEKQKELVNAIKNNSIIIAEGRAGTGKTYVTLCECLNQIKNSNFKKLILVKSVTTLESESLGFLKGTIEEKLEPVMYSFTGNIIKIIGKSNFENLKMAGIVEFLPIAYIRGLSLSDAIIVLDEAQNVSIDNIRTIMSRFDETCKLILLGDTHQKDLKNKRDSGLDFIITHFKNIEQLGIIQFTKDEIIRNPLIKVFEDRFDELYDNGTIEKLQKSK